MKNAKANANKNTKSETAVTVTPEYIKKTLKFDESGVLQINIKYPGIKIMPAGDYKKIYKKSEDKINNFYETVIKSFMSYCEKRLYKYAASEFTARKNNEDGEIFKPYGAVITYEVTYNKNDFLSVCLDINIFAGKGRGNSVRKTQIWRISSGELIPPKKAVNLP